MFRSPAAFGLGLAMTKLFQEQYLAQIEEYDVGRDGSISVRIRLPDDPMTLRLGLRRARVTRNRFIIAASKQLLAQSLDHSSRVKTFLEGVAYPAG